MSQHLLGTLLRGISRSWLIVIIFLISGLSTAAQSYSGSDVRQTYEQTVPEVAGAGEANPLMPPESLTDKPGQRTSHNGSALQERILEKIIIGSSKISMRSGIKKMTRKASVKEIDPTLKQAIIYFLIAFVLSIVAGLLYFILVVGLLISLVALVFWILGVIKLIEWLGGL